jgi:hypothetical protein
MKPFTFILSFFVFACCMVSATAEPLTDKQARDAAARIDSLIAADLKAANLRPNGRIDDATFLRRAYLGIIGRIPTEKEYREFMESSSASKREELVNTLVFSPGFDSHLFNWTADLLRVQTKQEQFGLGWHVWLRKSLAEDKPWDTIVNEMLSATGHTADNPAVGYYLRDRNMQLDNFSNSMQVFLGRQIGCAQCHDHPFDDWSQLEYYQMAAFGGGFEYYSTDARETVRRVAVDLRKTPAKNDEVEPKKKNFQMTREERNEMQQQARKINMLLRPVFGDFNKNAVYDNPSRSLHLPEDYKYKDAKPKSSVMPETLFGATVKDVPAEERRETFAKWVTSRENPYFTKVIVNRLWARSFGHGLLNPVDDWKEDSKPAHPEVLAFLETSMKAVDYDLRQFCRILFLTNLFQRECNLTEPEPGVSSLVQGPSLQRMTSEQLHDSMLVLLRGEIDDSPLAASSNRWESYTASIEKLRTADSEDLVTLGESASYAEDKFRALQKEVRDLRAEYSKADTADERSKIYAKIRDTQQKSIEFKKQSRPMNMMAMEMNSMEMSGEKDTPRKGMKNRREGDKHSSVRISEQPAPFNPGTLVREFGGSDRASPSSGNTVPTAPQALALLNDPQTDIVGERKNAFNSRLFSLKNPEERLDFIFNRLYSRTPTTKEKERFLPLAKDDTSLRDLSRAMLTSNQFIFVQ